MTQQLIRREQTDLRKLILDRVSEYDVYVHLIGRQFHLNTVMKSPLPGHKHGDRNPSFSIGCSPSGKLVWRDYSADIKGGPFDLAEKMYGITYPQALQKIAKEFGLLDGKDDYKKVISSYQQPVIEESHKTLIQVRAAKWNQHNLKYWKQYGIDQQELEREEIYPIAEWYLNRHKQVIKQGENCYAYRFPDDRFKIYYPDRSREEGKWKSNVSGQYIEKLAELNGSPKVIITKSRKDRLTLSHIVGIPVINCQNEGSCSFTAEVVDRLKDKEVWVSFDSDSAGVANCKKICDQYGYKYVNTPRSLLDHNIKDWADWVKHTGSIEEPKQFLTQKGVI
jgi:5S rRNA maturation endonuclease (ribonuclease M5)